MSSPPALPDERKLDGFVASLMAVRPFWLENIASKEDPFTVNVPFVR
jgi:hypothetical protein